MRYTALIESGRESGYVAPSTLTDDLRCTQRWTLTVVA